MAICYRAPYDALEFAEKLLYVFFFVVVEILLPRFDF